MTDHSPPTPIPPRAPPSTRVRTAVVDVDVAGPLPPLSGLRGYRQAYVVARLRGVPVGAVTVPLTDGACSARTIARALLGAHAEGLLETIAADWVWRAPEDRPPLRLESLLALTSRRAGHESSLAEAPLGERLLAGPLPSVTLAVCTRDRAGDLARCLDAIARLDYHDLDVLVVDNAPATDATREMIAERYSWVRYVREPRPGLDWARNRAIHEATGEILAFTDDDVEVEPEWIRALARVFADAPEVACVTGLVLPAELETEAQRLFEKYGGFTRGLRRLWHRVPPRRWRRRAIHHGSGQYGTGANMAFRRALFDEIGGFDPALDVGTATNGGGDLEMFFRVLQEGHALVYEPAAVVRHRHRREYAELRHQLRQWGIGFVSYVARSVIAYPGEAFAFLDLMRWWTTKYALPRAARSLVGRMSGVPVELIAGEIRGALLGVPSYGVAARTAADIGVRYPDQPSVATQPAPGRRVRRPRLDASAVRTAELFARPEPLTELAGYATARVYLTAHGRPVARADVPVVGDVVSATQMGDVLAESIVAELLRGEARTRALAELEAWLAPPDAASQPELFAPGDALPAPSSLSASVVIATADRPDDLRACLTALSTQRVNRAVEVVVVDNRPASGRTPPVVAEFPGVRLVEEPRAGLSYARNAGFRAARGDILIATDDDATMPPQWLEAIVAPFARPDVMIVTGNVLPLELETRAQQLFEAYGGLGRGFRRSEADRRWFDSFDRDAVETWRLGATANAAFRRELLAHPDVGLLDESLGAGTPTQCGEDTYLFYRALRAGFTSVYEPAAFVWHRHRRDMRALRRQIYGYTKGHVAYHLTTLVEEGDRRALLRLLRDMPRHHLRALVHFVRVDRGYPLSLTFAEIAGHLAGPFAFWRARARARRLGRSGPLEPRPAAGAGSPDPSPVGALRAADSANAPAGVVPDDAPAD